MLKSSLALPQAGAACSVALHASLLAWIAWPQAEQHISYPRMVEVELVRASSPESTPAAAPTAPEPPPPPAREATQRLRPPSSRPVRHVRPAPMPARAASAATPPTSGMVAPQAMKTLSAEIPQADADTALHNKPPAYPESARRRGLEGKVLLEVEVNAAGSPDQVSIRHSSGHTVLDEAARESVEQWRFPPAPRRIIQAITFNLD